MTALYFIANEYRADLAKLQALDLDEQTLTDTLESMGGDLEIKAQNVALFARSLDAEAAAVKQWAKDASARAKAIDARAERLREYLANCMTACGIDKISGPAITLSFRASSAVVIDGVDLVPAEFMRQQPAPAPEPDKTAIAAAIKAGAEVPGAHLEHRRSLQVK
jgi:hypothetical protein